MQHSDLTEAELEQQTQLMKTLTAAVYDQPSDPAPYAGPAGKPSMLTWVDDQLHLVEQQYMLLSIILISCKRQQ